MQASSSSSEIQDGFPGEARPESRKARSNRVRTEATRTALIESARELFATKGYAETGTPEIVARAGVTRGALYHHFADKLELFRAVVESEAMAVAERVAERADDSSSALDGMLSGADAYFEVMSEPGRGRLLLLEGPAVLGIREVDEIDRRTGADELRQGLERALAGHEDRDVPLDALTKVLAAAFDKAALAMIDGEPIEPYREALKILIGGIPGMDPGPS